MAVVLTDRLEIGVFTFLVRLVIQILSYAGVFLLGLLVVGHAPRIATVSTHDIINRTVGGSTATSTAARWFKTLLISRGGNGDTSRFLSIALALSLSYHLLAALSDIGFVGLEVCDVPALSYPDQHASLRSLEAARSTMDNRMVNASKPEDVTAFRCDAAANATLPNTDATILMCTAWKNSTYADADAFRGINLTDSDVLVPRRLQRWNQGYQNQANLNAYLVGGDQPSVAEPVIENGLAIIPHERGVALVVGTPNMPRRSTVTIPKTMVVEVDVGCIPVGMIGLRNRTTLEQDQWDYFMIDSFYQKQKDAQYAGPEHLRATLSKYADEVRAESLSWFNMSSPFGEEYVRSYNQSTIPHSWHTSVKSWMLPQGLSTSDALHLLLSNCTADIESSVNAEVPLINRPAGLSRACGLYRISGSQVVQGAIIQKYSNLICGTTTQINMASATITVDANGKIFHSITNLPSDFLSVQANMFDIDWDSTGRHGIVGYFDPILRYVLADNPQGRTQHFIHQSNKVKDFGLDSVFGAGSMGTVLKSTGAVIMDLGLGDDGLQPVLNATYMSLEGYNASAVTRWAGRVGAAYLLGSLAINPWSAPHQVPVEVRSTGGQTAVCYRAPYALAFVPLVLAALTTLAWMGAFVWQGRVKGAKRVEMMYGGLTPAIAASTPAEEQIRATITSNQLLAWRTSPQPCLVPIVPGEPMMDNGSRSLVAHLEANVSDTPVRYNDSE